MNTISNYVETMFMNLPNTDELNYVKEDILNNMEDKYYELLSEGKSENESIGLVISEFGNIEELLAELEIKKQTTDSNYLLRDFTHVRKEEIDEFIEMRKGLGSGVGFGVILCGVAASIIIFSSHINSVISGVILSLFVIAIAVSLFIINGLKSSKFNYLEKGFLLDTDLLEYIKEENKGYEKSFVFSLVLGITLTIISSIPILMGVKHEESMLVYVCGTIIIATIGCFFLIYGGTVKGGYTFLIDHGIDSSISEEAIKKQLFWNKFDDNFWILIVAAYLLVSFVFGWWEITWIIFPIAAVLSGIWSSDKDK